MISRKKFLILCFSSLALATFPNINSQEKYISKDYYLDKNLNLQIIKFNKNREYQLKNNLKEEIKKDHNEGRTIWIEKSIYTFAELYQI